MDETPPPDSAVAALRLTGTVTVCSSHAGRRRKKRVMSEVIQEQQAESVRHKSDLEFRRLLEKLPAAAYTCDAEGHITYFNQHAVELWGCAPKLNDPVDRY